MRRGPSFAAPALSSRGRPQACRNLPLTRSGPRRPNSRRGPSSARAPEPNMLNLLHLDERTRRLMLDEIDRDVNQGTLYISPRLSNTGQQNYLALLKQA